MYSLFCVVLCIVCVYMRTVVLPPGGYQIAVKYILSLYYYYYHYYHHHHRHILYSIFTIKGFTLESSGNFLYVTCTIEFP